MSDRDFRAFQMRESPSLCAVNVPPWIGATELAANPQRGGGGPPPVPDHLIQDSGGFAVTQDDGTSLILI